jgi:dihydrofolate synthase/folylpolyglutamate synthase
MDARGYLESLIHFGQKFGLETMHALCDALDHPERAYPTLLIAGTNGKGSVSAYLDHALRAGGLRVGRYTSPHLVRLNERIVVDGREIDDAAFEAQLARLRATAEALQAAGTLTAPPTHFEALTVAAFDHFRESRVDVAVLEVGMGGRLDATNVSDPLVSAIVSIDFDHEAYLGTTLSAIAFEKAGVLRPGRPTVMGPMPAEAENAIHHEADRIGAEIVPAANFTYRVEDDFVDVSLASGLSARVKPLPGAHQRDNLSVAVRVLERAAARGLRFDLSRALDGLSRVQWPGRLQWIPGEVPLLLDGAHNAAGARSLAAYLTDGPPFVLLFGAMRDKAFVEMARILFPHARAVVATQPAVPRAATADEIIETTRDLGVPCEGIADVARALEAARARARGHGPVVVAGSLYLVGAVLACLEDEAKAGR